MRDYAAVEGNGKLTLPITKAALELEGIDERGLDEQDRQFLRTMIDVYEGGPVGIEAIAATMGEERDTLEDVIEPYLLQNAFVTRTRQGRRATKLAYEHLGLKWKSRRNRPTGTVRCSSGGRRGGRKRSGRRGDPEIAKNDRKDDRKRLGDAVTGPGAGRSVRCARRVAARRRLRVSLPQQTEPESLWYMGNCG